MYDIPLTYNFTSNQVTNQSKVVLKQGCIPVGCVPPAAVAIWGGSPPGTPQEQAPPTSRHPLGADTPSPGPGTHAVNRILDTRL